MDKEELVQLFMAALMTGVGLQELAVMTDEVAKKTKMQYIVDTAYEMACYAVERFE